ncbi:MAG TPA: AMP-dependent synthetase/ligase [Solirubrobacterales bacterium]|nr:AMP-dependent synthetase/ligase [Solirubrobacterales bacterium]
MERATVEQSSQAKGMTGSTVAEAFVLTARARPEQVAIRTRGGETEITWGDYLEQVDRVALGLRELGVKRGDVVALMLNNRPEFHLADTAAMSLGATPFSLYQTLAPEQIAYQVNDSGAEVIVTEPAFLGNVKAALADATGVKHVVLVDGDGSDADTIPFSDLLATEGDAEDVARSRETVDPGDLLTLIYTSGTTGPPKGVQITHDNIMSAVRGFQDVIDFPAGARVVSYLPMAHIAERATGHYIPIVLGHSVTCCPNPREVIAYLPEVRPSWFFAVPRIWEKLKAGLEAMVGGEQDAERKRALEWAIEVGHQKVRLEQSGRQVPDELAQEHAKADEMVLSKLRAQLGLDQLEAVYVGAAPTPLTVLEFFHAIGVPVAELWGLSESCGSGTVNLPDAIKLGTVGQVAPNMELKLADDGEILIRGPQIMKGYRNMPDKTAETIDSEGWLHTGDIGELDDEGYLKIVDRKKELIINAAGKNISPANLESKLKAHPLVGTACVIGDQKPYLTALVVLDADVAPVWAAGQGIEDTSLESLAQNDAVRAEIQKGVDDVNSQVSQVEGIKKFTVLGTDWLPGGDELTPTMKLKRKPIAQKYGSLIEAMYA